MKSTLRELYNGNLDPSGQFTPTTREYLTLRAQAGEHSDELLSELKRIDPALAERFDRVMDEEIDVQIMELNEMFVQGFRLGARMMLEVCTGAV